MAAVVVDSSVVIAYFNDGHPDHERVSDWLDGSTGRLVTTPLIVAESDSYLARYGGPEPQQLFHENLRSGALAVEWWATAMQESVELAGEHGLELADASLIALAVRVHTTEVATLDERLRGLAHAASVGT